MTGKMAAPSEFLSIVIRDKTKIYRVGLSFRAFRWPEHKVPKDRAKGAGSRPEDEARIETNLVIWFQSF